MWIKMWPMKLDMTREECCGVLRRLELESYGNIISTFRAQGFLCKEKLRILEDLRGILHISNDRHRAEARRVANDERLNTVAEIIHGPNSSQDWRREGHRTFPILPRSVPHTALTYIANTVYEQLTRANCKLPHPANTTCDRLKKADEMFKFDMVRKELALFEKGFERDAAVVTSDPLQDIMSKSYINNFLERTNESTSEDSRKEVVPPTIDAENKTDTSQTIPAGTQDQPSLSDILLDNSSSATNPSNTLNKSATNTLNKTNLEKPKKPTDRSRKKSQGTKRQGKVKSPYPAGKLAKNGHTNSAKQSSKATSIPNPHLMHSYAVPFDLVCATNGVNPHSESPQLQQHLTSNMPYPAHHGNQQYNAVGQTGKTQQTFPTGSFSAAKTTPPSPIHNASSYAPQSGHFHSYKHPQGILPSSKKDIQYNLSKLNPTNSIAMKGNVNIPIRGSANHTDGNALPQLLINYQKKSNSKNILIPTSAAAATLASLGFPPSEHTSDWMTSKHRDTSVKPVKTHTPQDVPNSRVVFSSSSAISAPTEEAVERSKAPSSSTTGQDKTVTCPPTSSDSMISTQKTAQSTVVNSSVKTNIVFNQASASSVVNNVLPLKQLNIAGFTPVKSGNKLSVSKTQLMPLGAQMPAVTSAMIPKNNVFILPKSNTSGMLNLGQKISVSKSIVDSTVVSSAAFSPPKVIVQAVPDLNNITTCGIDQEQTGKQQIRQLFTAEKLFTESTQVSPLIESDQGKTMENSQSTLRSASAEGVCPPVQPHMQNIVPGDSPPVRKITISTSQLLPFKGALHGTALPLAAISNSVIMGSSTKKAKLTTCTVADGTTKPARASNTDWEKEVDRANATPIPSTDAIASPIPTTNAELAGDKEVKLDSTLGLKKQHECNSYNGKSMSIDSILSAENEVEIVQGDYDPISTDRGDDSSATDSADAEEDLEDDQTRTGVDDGVEEDDYDDEQTADVETDTDGIIIEEDEANYDSLIEEIPEDDNYIVEIVEEQMEVGYETSRELITEMEGTSEHGIGEPQTMNGIEDEPSSMHVEQCSEMISEETIENSNRNEQSLRSAKDDIVCELLEIDADGTYSTRQFSYEQAIAEGLTVLPSMAKPSYKINRSVS